MSIATSTAKVQYTLSGTVQALPIPFYFLENAHIKAIRSRAGEDDYVMVLGTDYTLTGAADEDGGTLTTIATNMDVGDKITIKRNISITQSVNYVYNDRFPAETHERALDKLTMVAQQLKEQVDRAVQFSESEVGGVGNQLPIAEDRAGKILGFSPDGTALQLLDPVSAVFAEGDIIQASSITALKAVSVTLLTTGYMAHVSGYYAAGDGAGGLFVYDSASSATANNGTIISPNAGTGRWKRAYSGEVNAKWFGAKGDGVTADNTYVQAALTWLKSLGGGTLYLPRGTYLWTDHVYADFGNLTIRGDGMGATIIKVGAWVSGLRVSPPGYGSGPYTEILRNVEVCHLSINGNRTGYVNGASDTYGNGIHFENVENYSIHHCHVYDVAEQGIVAVFFGITGSEVQSQANICDNIVDMSNSLNIAIGMEAHHTNFTVSRNRVKCTGGSIQAIFIASTEELSEASGLGVVSDNILIGSGAGDGIQCEQVWHNLTISGNIVRLFGNGIRCSRSLGALQSVVSITGNTVVEFAAYGISTSPDSAGNQQASITGNLITTSLTAQAGAILAGGSTFTGNRIKMPTPVLYGMTAGGRCFISGNTIDAGAGLPVNLTVNDGTTLVAGNHFNDGVNNRDYGRVAGNYPLSATGTRTFNHSLDVGQRRIIVSNTPPATGAWLVGDIVINNAAVAGGFAGWICTTAGTPGTWKTFGVISA
jgi:hypothetical protein